MLSPVFRRLRIAIFVFAFYRTANLSIKKIYINPLYFVYPANGWKNISEEYFKSWYGIAIRIPQKKSIDGATRIIEVPIYRCPRVSYARTLGKATAASLHRPVEKVRDKRIIWSNRSYHRGFVRIARSWSTDIRIVLFAHWRTASR